jgi:Family of unknown function (DUF6519)
MKADLTRDTFHPLKHYARVLTQQGRVQLDADMNEQTAILLRYLHILAADLIGPAGGPQGNVGFAISPLTPVPNPPDFQIGFGNYYVNGLLCQADFTPIAFFPTTTANVFQVLNWSSDFELKTIPYFEVFDGSQPSQNAVAVQITNPQKAQSQITIQPTVGGTSFSSCLNPKLRRVITYLHQPDFVFSADSGAISPPPLPSSAATTFLQIYLDVWERAITYAEDDSIREVALGGPDTAARSKLVWQVKVMQATGVDQPPCGTPPPPAPRGWLQAMAKQSSQSTNPCIINPNASYTGPENQLYRVEINRGGTAGTTTGSSATFKWSRENGSVIYPIASGGGTAAVVVESLGRDDRFGLIEGNLVEAQDDRSVLLNLPGNLLPVQFIDSTTMTVTLNGTPDPVLGSDETLHPLLRRWDQTQGDPAEGGLTLDNDNAAFVQEGVWLTLEDGVQIRFQPADPVQSPPSTPTPPVNQYLTGDYWLIPARTATGDVEWPKVTDAKGNPETDAQGNVIPIALPPHGITHYYAPLAVVSVSANGVSMVSECRSSFAPAAVPMPKNP